MNFLRQWPYYSAIFFTVVGSIVSRNKWPSFNVDSFSSYEIFRKMSLGFEPYQDFAFYYGPFSIYLNKLIFKIFSPTITNIQWVGTLVACINISLFCNILQRMQTSNINVFLTSLSTLSIFCFGFWEGNSLINWVFPQNFANIYVISGTLLLSRSLLNHFRSKEDLTLAWVGIVICSLSRFEYGIASFALVSLYNLPKDKRSLKRIVILFSAFLFSLTIYIIFAYRYGVNHFLFENIFWIGHTPSMKKNPYQLNIIGVSFSSMMLNLNYWFYGTCTFYAFMQAFKKNQTKKLFILFNVLGIFLIILLYFRFFIDPFKLIPNEQVWSYSSFFLNEFTRVTPLVVIVLIINHFKAKKWTHCSYGFFTLLCMCRIIGKTEINSYFYYMCLPAFLYICFSIFEKKSVFNILVKRFTLFSVTLYSLLFGYHSFSRLIKKNKKFIINGQDLYAFPYFSLNKNIFNSIQWANQRLNLKNKKVLPLPESSAINYFTNTNNPLFHPHYYFAYFNSYSEEKMIKDIEENNINYIFIVHDYRPSIGGGGLFGTTFAKNFKVWIDNNFEVIKQFGRLPHQEKSYNDGGVLILKRKTISSQ